MIGLSDRAQAVILLIASALIGASGLVASLPSDIPPDARGYLAVSLLIGGAVGFALKEALGGQGPSPGTTTTTTTTSNTTQNTTSNPENGVSYGEWQTLETIAQSVYGPPGTTIYVRTVFVNGTRAYDEVQTTKPF